MPHRANKNSFYSYFSDRTFRVGTLRHKVVLPVEFVDNAVGKPHTGEQDCVNPTYAQHIGEYPQRRDNHLRTAPVQVELLHALGYGHGPHRHGCEHPKAAQKEQKTKVCLHGRKIWLPEEGAFYVTR